MELANQIVEAVLKEAVKDKIVVYAGRFQPFHKGHKKVYDSLVSKFGSKNVYIASSDVQDSDKSPLSFNEKKEIATKLFGIPSSKFVKVRNPYNPVEILRGYDEKTTAYISVVGEKDSERLGGGYFKPYKNDKDLKGYGVEGYVFSNVPSNSFGATDVRNMFRSKRMKDETKQKEFTKYFGKFDKSIYNKLNNKLNENVINESFDVLDALILAVIQGGVGLSIGAVGSYLMGGGLSKIKDWWKQHKNNDDVKRIVNKLKNDSQLKKAIKNQNPKDIKNVVKNKVSRSELNNLKNLSEGFPGGVGVGLTLPNGYINGAPDNTKKKKKDEANVIPGGLADNKTLVDIAKKYAGDYYDYRNVLEVVKEQLKKGIKVEMEHTSDIRIAAEIAKDHIWEDLNYYKALNQIEKPKTELKEENPNYQNDSDDWYNILNSEFSVPATGHKMKIKDALKLPITAMARQEAIRLMHNMAARLHVKAAGNIEKGQQSPETDKPKQANTSYIGPIYTEASAVGSGYDEKVLDQLVDNPETNTKVKVRSALNYDKNHPSYKAAIALVRKAGATLPQKKVGGQKHPVAVKNSPQARAHTTQQKPQVNKSQQPNVAQQQPNATQQPNVAQQQPQQKKPAPMKQTEPVDDKGNIVGTSIKVEPTLDDVPPKFRDEVNTKITDLQKHFDEDKKRATQKVLQRRGLKSKDEVKPEEMEDFKNEVDSEREPTYNLCQISVPGTNLYCSGNRGIPRKKMPQFKGKPQPGSQAEKDLEAAKKAGKAKPDEKEANGEALYRKMLDDKGIKVTNTEVPAESLKATQTELVGDKVLGMEAGLEADPTNPNLTAPLYVSKDGYVIDGHHRWAAITSYNIKHPDAPIPLKVMIVDQGIDEAIQTANDFANEYGVAAKSGQESGPGSEKEVPQEPKPKKEPKQIKNVIKDKIKNWADNEKKFFKNGNHKENSKFRRSIGKAISDKAKAIIPSIKREMQHLGHEYKSAGEGLAELFKGKKPNEEQLKGLKSLGKTVALSALGVAIGGGIGHGMGMLVKHLGGHMAQHIVGELAASGIGKAAIFAGTEMEGDNEKYVEWFILHFAKQMKDGKIPADVWEMAIQDYNNDIEDGKYTSADFDKTKESTNEILSEMGSKDIHFKNIVDKLKHGNYTIRKKIAMAVAGKYTASRDTIVRALRNMGYDDIINVEKEADIEMNEVISESLLIEGGAYGHMAHPFDVDMNLTFGDLKNIINNALDGNLGVVREKTDGQALAISWKNGRLIAARNKGNLANAGANAMDAAALASKFNGRGALSDAYNFAMKDLESAIRGLSQAQKDKIFKNGKCFVNLEVIWPTSVNVIPYGQPLLVFHNAIEYNDAGNAIGKVDGAESILAGMIKQINAHVQSKYTIQGPPITQLPKSQELSSKKSKYISQLNKLQSEFKLNDNDGVADYHQAYWRNFVTKSKQKLSGVEIEGLIKRWAFDNKSFTIKSIVDDKARAWAEGIDKNSKVGIAKQNLRKFEDIFLGVGAEVLSFMSSVLTAQPDKALQSIRKRLDATVAQIRKGGSEAQIKKLELELARLEALGGFDKIVPNEGLVFQYGGNTYKLTGAFAPLNQILGIFY